MSDLTKLDPAAIQRLQRLGGQAFVAKMLDLFLEYGAAKIQAAGVAYAAGNLSGVEESVHPLKSSAGNVGATRVQELAGRIEGLACQNHPEQLGDLLEELKSAFDEVRPELEQLKASSESSAALNQIGPNQPPTHQSL